VASRSLQWLLVNLFFESKFSSIAAQEMFRFSILIFPPDDPLADFGQWEDFFIVVCL